MKFILLMLYFTASPAPPGTKDRVWSLQSTSVMEFSSKTGCERVGASITSSIAQTSTMTVRGWCFCEAVTGVCPTDPKMKSFSSNNVSVGIQTLEPPETR